MIFFTNDKDDNLVIVDMSDQVSEQNSSQIKILLYSQKPKKRKKILEECLGLSNHNKNFKKYIEPLLNLGLLERTIPDKPTSQNQKYKTTENGIKVINRS